MNDSAAQSGGTGATSIFQAAGALSTRFSRNTRIALGRVLCCRNAAVEMIPRGRSRVTRVLVAVAAASFVLLFTGVVSWTRDETSGPIASAFASVIRGAFFVSALALAAVVAWRRRQANRDASNGGGGSDKGAHQRWDGSRWVDVESQSQAVPSAVNAKTTNGFGGGNGRDTSASVQRPPGPSSYDPTTPYADDASTSTGASLNGDGTYQGNETPEEARRRLHREQQDAAYWARVEREDEERERREEEREEALLERERERRAAKKEKRREQRAEAKAEKMREKASSKSDKWARHEARWNALEATVTTTVTMGTDGSGSGSEESAPLRYDDVPWPPKMSAMLRHACDGGGDKERKLAYHRLLRRWHPDKFGARYGPRVAAGGDGDRVMERVNAVARALNQEFARRS